MKSSTPIPNVLFDSCIPHFTESELKVILVIARKTLGWYDKKTGRRKRRDWIAMSQFKEYTGLSDVSVWNAIASLSERGYIRITDERGNVLLTASERKGRRRLFYGLGDVLLKYF